MLSKVRDYYPYDRDLGWVASLSRVGSSLPLPLGKTEPEGPEHQVGTEELEGMSFGKPEGENSGITDYRKNTCGLRTPRLLSFLKTQVVLINVKHFKKGLPKCGIVYIFNPSSTSGMDLGALYLWGHSCISSFPVPSDLDRLIQK